MSSGFGGPPQWPPIPPKPAAPPTVGRRPWWRRHKGWLGLGAGVVVVGLVAGALVWQGSRQAEPDRAAFETALASLAAQPAIRYDTGAGAGTSAEIQVTYTGDVLGTMTVAGQKVSTITVNGTTYVKMPNLLGDKAADPTGLAGKWITGSKASATAGTSSTASGVQTPAALANRLFTSLNSRKTVLSDGKSPADDVDGTRTRKASTPDGDLFITRDEPYRLLRYVPKSVAGGGPSGLPSLPTLPPMPSLPSGMPSLPSGFPSLPSAFPSLPSGFPSLPGLPSDLGLGAHGTAYTAVAPARYATPAGTLDLTELAPQDVDAFYRELQDSTKQLKTAINSDIDFSLKGKADLSCSAGGCSVVAHVSSDVTSGAPGTKIAGGQVNATLTATVEIEGEPAGTCTATAVLPLKGTNDIGCEDGTAGAVFAEQEALKKEEAEAQSEAEGGEPVPYSVSSSGQAIVQALAQVDVDALLAMEQVEQQLLDAFRRNATPTPTPTATGSANPTLAPTDAPTGLPSSSPTAVPTAPPGDDDGKKKPTCVDRPPADHEPNGPDGWTYYSPVGWQKRATGAAVCLSLEAASGAPSNSGSPGMDVAKARAAKLFPSERTPVNSCHLIPQALGGRGVMANLSPCWTKPVNVGEMTRVQGCVTGLMKSGVVQMLVAPVYKTPNSLIPYLYRYQVEAWDLNGNTVPQNCSAVVYNEKDGYFLNGDD
ncbi:hypothetical protein [Streptomyces sp. NBC_01198]|uniref:hypothetical protein n=1 Tax=Streptomyces sp. NBC_01198 TaxID=2903769 RepID=UPI002E158A6F|nr:hypothetical protein OG702_21695 [Streptomyces sp. NBC_01198]